MNMGGDFEPEAISLAAYQPLTEPLSREPLLSLDISATEQQADSDSEYILESYERPRGGWTSYMLGSKAGNCRYVSRQLLWCAKLCAGFAFGFIFALFFIPFGPWPEEETFDVAFRNFKPSLGISPFALDYPTEFMKSVLPVPCHSHNDYWHRLPLYSALGTGCISIEADVWDVRNELYVGHKVDDLAPEKTLRNLYLDPLVEILEHMNLQNQNGMPLKGVFNQDPKQTFVLLIDLKREDAWPVLVEELNPLRDRGYLSFWNGEDRVIRPVTIVASGAAPFDLITKNETYRDIFYDAPLHALDDCFDHDCPLKKRSTDSTKTAADLKREIPYKYNPSNSYYASTSLFRAVGSLPHFEITDAQLGLIRHQVKNARERGLIPRYWGTPRWPKGFRDAIWAVLLREDVGVLNVDDLRAVRKGSWGVWPQPSK